MWAVVGLIAIPACSAAPPPPHPARPPADPVVERALEALVRGDAALVIERLETIRREGGVSDRRAADLILILLEDQVRQREQHLALQEQVDSLQVRLSAIERALVEEQARADETAQAAERLEAERAHVVTQLGQAREALDSCEEQVTTLQKKLDALKRIDLEREP